MDMEGNLELAMDALHRATTVFVKVRATSLATVFVGFSLYWVKYVVQGVGKLLQ